MAYKNHAPPPYPYQQQSPQGNRSGEYAQYPQVNQEQWQQQSDQRYGTPVMGAPANPNAHPDNKYAATGEFRQSSAPFRDQEQATQTQTAPSVPGQVPHESYVQASPTSTTGGTTGGSGSMDQIKAQVSVFSKRAEVVMGNLWGHLRTGSSVADTAWGRVTAGTQVLSKGGFEGVFKATFPTDADEKLKKTYACFLSTSTGPVGGTLYISTKKLAFCSDRPLSYTPPDGQQSFSYYKVIIPVNKIRDVQPSSNRNKPAEKYIQVTTHDNFEFWFMGFVNYDKGLKNLQAAVGTGAGQPTGAYQQPYPPNQPTGGFQHQPYPPNSGGSGSFQQPYPPNQGTNQGTNQKPYDPNQYGT